MDINLLYTQNGQQAIHLATSHGEVEMVRALIRMGSSPTACTDDEVSLLVYRPTYRIHYCCI